MSRNCRSAVSGGPTERQDRPPSTVRRTGPPVPLAQATRSLTAARPRSRAVVPLSRSFQEGVGQPKPLTPTNPTSAASAIDSFGSLMEREHTTFHDPAVPTSMYGMQLMQYEIS